MTWEQERVMKKNQISSALVTFIFIFIASSCGGGGSDATSPPPSSTFSISGTVSGVVSSGVTVTLSGATSSTTTTDASGNYNFTGLLNGTYNVSPGLTGYNFNPLDTNVIIDEANVTNVNFTASAAPPNIVSDTCAPLTGPCISVFYNYSGGLITGATSLVYIKNIGGSGVIDVAVSAGDYTENKQFAVNAEAKYVLRSIIPATLSLAFAPYDSLDVTASFQGLSVINEIGPILKPSPIEPYIDTYYDLVPNGPPSSSLNEIINYTVSGTVMLPDSVTDKQWIVGITDDSDGGGEFDYVAGVVIGSTFNYSIDNVPSGDYFIYGEVDMTGVLGPWDTGDYVGFACGTIDSRCKVTVDSSKTIDFTLVEISYRGSHTITGASGNQVVLDGSWNAECKPDDDGKMEESVTAIAGSSFSVTGSKWDGAGDCSGLPDMKFSVRGLFTLGDEVTVTLTGSPVISTKFDGEITTALFTVYNADWVAEFNTNARCGATDWVVGTAKEVVGTDCMPASFKDIMYIDDIVEPDLMYEGLEEEKGGTLDANGYPTEIDADTAEERLSVTITGASGNQVALDGSWSAGCKPDDEGGMEEIVKTISGLSYSVTSSRWSGTGDCSGSPDLNNNDSGSFALGDEVTVLLNGSPVTATKIDYAATTALYTVYKDIIYIDDTVDPDLMFWGIGGTLDANGYPTELDANVAEERLSGLITPDLALLLDGVDDKAEATTTIFPDTNTAQSFTIEARIYPTAAGGDSYIAIDDTYALILFYDPAENNNGVGIKFILASDCSTLVEATEFRDVTLNQWNHVAVMFDASAQHFTISINGILSSSPVSFTAGTFCSDPADQYKFTVGGNYWGDTDTFQGRIDEVRISDNVRYNTDFTPLNYFIPDANTKGLWHFEESSGSTSFSDSSGNGNTLTGLNGAQTN